MSYLTFIERTIPGRKTVQVRIFSASQGTPLGCIQWLGRWRQYAFFPEPGTVWNPDCLRDVNERIASLMEARRAERVNP